MKVETMLNIQVGWDADVSVEEVNIQVHKKNNVDVVSYALDDNFPKNMAVSYFYALCDEGFYWGDIPKGIYVLVDTMEALGHLMEFEEIDANWLARNPKRIGPMITDNIIDDRDLFVLPDVLVSYQQIYYDNPLINNLRDYLTEYYETYIENTFEQEVNRERIRKALER